MTCQKRYKYKTKKKETHFEIHQNQPVLRSYIDPNYILLHGMGGWGKNGIFKLQKFGSRPLALSSCFTTSLD